MNGKKLQIVQSAIKLFGERDYHTTSIQDIASLAGVSKGAFYLHFHSKEELLISIYHYFFELIFQGLDQALSDTTASPETILRQVLLQQLKIIIGNKEFLAMMQNNGAAFIQNETVKNMMFETNLQILSWFQKRIIEVYGSPIEKYSLDCAIMLNSLLKDYLFYCLSYHIAMKPEEVASFLYERLDDLAQGLMRKNHAPIFSSIEMMQKQGLCGDGSTWLLKIEQCEQWIETNVEDQRTSDTLIQSIHAVVNELKKEEPNEIIIQGMYNYLLTLSKEYPPLLEQLEQLLAWRLGN
ncbi:TetR/AcrR family transcriptional regulator [Paenibacillus sp. OAS669]|uniref:TetR/AcrR family transcriptional regulator n=1 Tax=Paenibacillus sp. OAS669 TaxID=2663821 RepID=UPI00178902A7|nr:TetR/AcrR family transcriptional regulator [Paenibacillus sp. OAS669]MBE1443067.1 AcrR family transcriptional regulator [Paenibacillus sp. OAS669]